MSLFHVLEDVFVILRAKSGVYRQAKVYVRGDRVYAGFAGFAGGFIRLMQGNGTSAPNVSWGDLDAHPAIAIGRLGPAAVEASALPPAGARTAGAISHEVPF